MPPGSSARHGRRPSKVPGISTPHGSTSAKVDGLGSSDDVQGHEMVTGRLNEAMFVIRVTRIEKELIEDTLKDAGPGKPFSILLSIDWASYIILIYVFCWRPISVDLVWNVSDNGSRVIRDSMLLNPRFYQEV